MQQSAFHPPPDPEPVQTQVAQLPHEITPCCRAAIRAIIRPGGRWVDLGCYIRHSDRPPGQGGASGVTGG